MPGAIFYNKKLLGQIDETDFVDQQGIGDDPLYNRFKSVEAVVKGHIADNLTLAFWKFFDDHKALLIYLAIINVVTFITYAIDKINAEEGRSRIRIVTLLTLAFIGGSIGAITAMYLLRHKTQKDYFTVGVPLIIIMQVIVLFYIMNTK